MSRRSWGPTSLFFAVLMFGLLVGCGGTPSGERATTVKILNVSYDPTRELWKDLNQAFIPEYRKSSGVTLTVQQSHGGSGSQARSIIDGLKGDVATLSIQTDIDAIAAKGLIRKDWQATFPNNSVPYTSAIVFVVRKGNPKQIKDWPDLLRGDTVVITPSPKTSGNGKLAFLAAWGYGLSLGDGVEGARKVIAELYRRVPVLDTGARGATSTFAQKGIGDVHIALESEAWLEVNEAGGSLEIVYPPVSIIHEPPIAIVDATVDRRGTRAHAEAYLNFLYTRQGQEIIARHHFRPRDPEALVQFGDHFPSMKLLGIQDVAADWQDAQQRFFAEGAEFDQIYINSRK